MSFVAALTSLADGSRDGNAVPGADDFLAVVPSLGGIGLD